MKQKVIKVAIIIAVVLVVGVVYCCIKSGYTWYYGETDRGNITKQLSYVEYNNGNFAIVDSMNKVVGERFDYILFQEKGRLSLIFVKEGKRGFISTETGKQIFGAEFERAWIDNPRFGLAAYVKDDLLGFVNVRTGEYAIPALFTADDYHWCDFVFRDNGYCIVPGEDSKFGVIDTTGQIIIQPVYDDIDFLDFGFVKLKQGNKYALYDSLFIEILPMGYDYLSVNELGIVAMKGHSQQLLDFSGENVVNYLWIDQLAYNEYVSHLYEPSPGGKYDDDGKLSPYMMFQIGKFYGVFNASYKVIIPPIYSNLHYNGNGYFSCSVDEYGGAIIIDSNGRQVHGEE